MRSRARMWAAALAVAGALGTGGVAQATTWTVTNYADPTGGTCPDACSLRHAVQQSAAGDTIDIPAQNGLPVTLSQGAPIVVDHELTIAGAGADATTIDGSANVDAKQNPHRIFTAQAPLQLTGMTLTGGNAAGDDTCPSACSTIGLDGGGAIFSTATLNLDRVRLLGNRASLGGAVSSNGTLAMTDVEFSGDDAALAGGLFVRGGTASGTGVSFHDLGAGAYDGGAVLLYHGSLSLTNTTVANSGMPSGHAGGIENFGGTLTLRDDTLSGNVRGAVMTVQGATTEVGSTIIGAGWPDGDDWACVPAGRPTAVADGARSGAAITKDDGGNLDEDGHCGLSTTDDRSGDAHLAPLADNGGPTPTMALLHGSPALDALALCDAVDQRGTPRPQNGLCDIGAFEAERTGTSPTASTEAATDLDPHSAQLHATVDLGGESGGVHFEWGTSADVVAGGHGTVTAEAAAGRSSAAALTLDGLLPGRTYFFRAIADNASAASAPGATLSFTTPPGPPVVSDVAVDDQTDTTGKLSFSIDPDRADTSYVVRYGTDALTESTSPVDIGAQPGAQRLTTTLADLRPETRYYFEVVATSSAAPDGVTGNGQVDTERQVFAHPGGLLAAQDDGDGCPRATIDWGDGNAAAAGDVQCDDGGEFGQTYALRATHEYAQPGHYPILIDYGSAGTVREWAVIDGDPQHVLRVTVSGPGSVFGSGIECPDQCTTSADVGTQADLAVEPDDGATFLGWSGDCSGNDCSVTLDRDRAVTARFAGPPILSDGVGVEPVTDTTAKLQFTIDPNGSDTTYVIRYGTDETYGQSTDPVDLGADPGARSLSPELTGLKPDTTYHFVVEASNGASPAKVSSGDEQFTTEPQVSALAGQSVTVHDTGFSDTSDCPAATVDWGDDSTSAGDVTCAERPTGGQDYTLTASHTYAAAGHYPIQIAYDRGGGASALWALISAPQQATPTPTPSATPTPTPTPTATPTPNPVPVFHQQVVVRPVSGTVLVRKKGTHTFVPLDAKAGIPLGSQVDVTHGRIQLTSVPRRGGKPQSAQFYAGIFTVTQPGAITQLTLSGPKPTCAKAKGRAASAAAKKKKVKSRKLWGNGHGSFRTSGQYSAATVRGTQWLVQDTCAGTLTRVAHGLVAVSDHVRHKTILVRGGKSYLARPRR